MFFLFFLMVGFSLKAEKIVQIEKLKALFSARLEVGYWNDRALYASFGEERQLIRISSFVVSGQITKKGSPFYFQFDWAPYYDSIRREDRGFFYATPLINRDENNRVNGDELVYGVDSQGRPIYGGSQYVDWYKNLGSRVYYLDSGYGDFPFIDLFVGWTSVNNQYQVKVGRIRNLSGFSDKEMTWGDDAKFAPYAFWLSRNLFTGIQVSAMIQEWVTLEAYVFSGSNPIKGYAYYLGGIAGANLKDNNTLGYEGKVTFHLGDNVETFFSYQQNTMGSTWVDDLKDGKRLDNVLSFGAKVRWENLLFFDSIQPYLQWTAYYSGLSTDSYQNNGDARYREIVQKGFFAGVQLTYYQFLFDFCYEKIDRFDYNLFQIAKFSPSSEMEKSAQSSIIINGRYFFSEYVSLNAGAVWIDNPFEYASSILDTRGSYRYKLTIEFIY